MLLIGNATNGWTKSCFFPTSEESAKLFLKKLCHAIRPRYLTQSYCAAYDRRKSILAVSGRRRLPRRTELSTLTSKKWGRRHCLQRTLDWPQARLSKLEELLSKTIASSNSQARGTTSKPHQLLLTKTKLLLQMRQRWPYEEMMPQPGGPRVG